MTTATALPGLPGLDACDLLGPTPLGALCNATRPAADAVTGTDDGFGTIWTIITNPVRFFTEVAASFFANIDGIIADRAIAIDNPAVITLYGVTSALGIMYAVANVASVLGMSRGEAARKAWAFPGFLIYILLIATGIPLIRFAADLAGRIAGVFANIAGTGYEALFREVSTNLQGNVIARILPGASNGILLGMTLLYAVIAIVLWVELTILNAIVMVLTIAFPIYAVGMIHPAPRSDIPEPRRQAFYQYIDVMTAMLLAQVVVAAILALAGALITAGEVSTATALLLLAIFAPFALVTLLPIFSLAGGAAGVSRAALAPVAGAGRAARRAVRIK